MGYFYFNLAPQLKYFLTIVCSKYGLSEILSNKELSKEHTFDIIDLRLNPRVLPHVDVLMAVRFLRRVDSSDYIETLWESYGKEAKVYAYYY